MDMRDSKGRFVVGSGGGPGRPSKAVESRYSEAFQSRCPPEVWEAIIERAVADALAGDRYARAFLAERLLGPVKQELGVEVGPRDMTIAYLREARNQKPVIDDEYIRRLVEEA